MIEPDGGMSGDIEFRDVSYRHRRADAEEADSGGVRNVSLRIPAGGCIGLAGGSGAGKTTLADLLVGLLRPQAGEIRIAGLPVDVASSPHWREMLAYVSQDPFLHNDTIRHNLLWANPEASEAEIHEAIQVAGADAIVDRLPLGLNTVVGERGSLISGGERQRFAIARALLRKPRLLILDEATNAIDIDGERQLLGRLNALRPGLTLLLVAHRLETLSACDEIVVLEHGTVTAVGSFSEVVGHLRALEHVGS